MWRKGLSRAGKWRLELVKRLEHGDRRGARGETAVGSLSVPGGRKGSARSRSRSSVSGNSDVAITCVKPMAQCVYTGDEEGRVVSISFHSDFLILGRDWY